MRRQTDARLAIVGVQLQHMRGRDAVGPHAVDIAHRPAPALDRLQGGEADDLGHGAITLKTVRVAPAGG